MATMDVKQEEDVLVLKSSLKLQAVDDISGLYEWNRKIFTLNVRESTLSSVSVLEAASEGIDASKVTEFPIAGTLYAKEWTVSSPMAGYGFDLIWASGKTWSFLADDEETCRQWVESLNKSIAIAKQQSTEYMSSFADETTIVHSQSPDSFRSSQDKTVDQYNLTRSSSKSNSNSEATVLLTKTPPKTSPRMLTSERYGSGSSNNNDSSRVQVQMFDHDFCVEVGI